MIKLEHHRGGIRDIAFSPNGMLLASSGNDGAIRVWDSTTAQTGTIAVTTQGFGAVAFSPDGQQILTRPRWRGLQVWDLPPDGNGEPLILSEMVPFAGAIAVAPGTELVAAIESFSRPWRYVISLWDIENWEGTVLFESNRSFSGLAFDPSGSRLVTSCGVIDLYSGGQSVKREFPHHNLRWSPRDPLVAGTDNRINTVLIRDAESGEHVRALSLPSKAVQDLAFSPDGAYLAVVSNEEMVRVWRTDDWSERAEFSWGIGKLKCIAFAPDGLRAACGSHRGTILIWDWDL